MSDSDRIGTILEKRYRLKREIARGAGGVVYEAEHVYLNRVVALKLLADENRHVSELGLRLLREAEVLSLARGPGVVQVLDAGEADDVGPYLVMELLEGRTLEGVLTVRRQISVQESVHVGLQICQTLDLAHRHGVVHRDIKPGNIFLARDETEREVVKLIDFGIARTSAPGRKLTQQGGIVGTPEYMSPEQLLGQEELDGRADVYSLGIVLFECLTGAVPFEGTFGQILLKSSTIPAPPIRSKNPMVPPQLAAAVEKAIARNAAERHQSMQAFGEALRAIASPDGAGSLLGIWNPAPVPVLSVRPKIPVPPPLPPDLPAERRRRFPRAPYVTPVRIVRPDGKKMDGRSEDLSVGGMLVVMSGSSLEEELVKARFALPLSGKVVVVTATTRWVRTARGIEAVGLQFRLLAPDEQAEIEQYVQTMGATTSSAPTR